MMDPLHLPAHRRARRFAFALFAVVGCHRGASTTVHVEEVLRGQVRAARVDIGARAGELELKAGDCELFAARIEQDADLPAPEVDKELDGELARIWIRAPERSPAFDRDAQEWDICLSPAVRYAVEVDMGAGEARLDTRGLDLAELDVDLGAGEIHVDLRQRWTRDVTVRVDVGAGSIHVRLPAGVRVEASADTGVGSIEAPGFESHGSGGGSWHAGPAGGPTIHLDLDTGAGEIELSVAEVPATTAADTAPPDSGASRDR